MHSAAGERDSWLLCRSRDSSTSRLKLGTRFLGPIMNLILATLCALMLLRTSLLRRRTSFAPMAAVAAMALAMAGFMSASNMLSSLTDLGLLILAQGLVLFGIMFALYRK